MNVLAKAITVILLSTLIALCMLGLLAAATRMLSSTSTAEEAHLGPTRVNEEPQAHGR
jgi:flagellar basal body-associated protein FliL